MNNPKHSPLYLTYVNNAKDTTPKALTPEKLNQLLDANSTRLLVNSYRSTGDGQHKTNLPAVIFNGYYSPERAESYISNPTAADKKRPTRRDAPCFLYSDLLALDIDPSEGCTLTADEQFQRTWDNLEPTLGINPTDIVVMAYRSPTIPGWRLVVRRNHDLSIAQEHQRWNTILPLPCDAKCKDPNRLYFLTSRQDVMYLNTELLFRQTEICDLARAEQSDLLCRAGADSIRRGLIKGENGERRTENTHPSLIANRSTLIVPKSDPSLIANRSTLIVPNPNSITDQSLLEDIVSELEHCVGGGTAKSGNRNNQVFEMASLLQHVTGKNIALLHTLIPRYGLSTTEHIRAITNATKSAPLPYIPMDLQRAIDRATNKANNSSTSSENTPPAMPQVLPPAIAHLVSVVPQKARAATAITSFAAWRIHLHEVGFHYIDNLVQEPCFLCICNAEQTAGKTATRMPAECILESIFDEDKKNRDEEERWREECASLSSNQNKPKAPRLPIRIVEADMTNPTLVKRAINAQGYSLYTYAEEIEKLQHLRNLSEIMRCSYDSARYGQERVSASSVSMVADKLRWSFIVSTTPSTARSVFKNETTNGTSTRISLCTIMSDPYDFGDEMPVYGNFDQEYKLALMPYIQNLRSATGTIYCAEAEEWAERERQRQIDILRAKDMRYMLPFMKRSLQMGFWRAVMLYIMNGNQWSQDIEDFASWSIDYDLWCKLYYLGDLIEASVGATPDNSRYTTSLLPLLPHEFTREQARNMRRDIGRSTNAKDVRNMLTQWVFRGFIYYDKAREIYVKTETENRSVI